jgi:hypothetical protein
MSTKDETKNEKKGGNGTTAKPETLTVDEAFARWNAQGGLVLVKTIADELTAMVRKTLDAEIAEETARREKMDAHFKALGGAPPLDEAEQAAAKRKRSTRPAPTTDSEIVARAVEYIRARNAKNNPPEARGLARCTGHDSAKVEALLVDHPDVFKGGGKWHLRTPIAKAAEVGAA